MPVIADSGRALNEMGSRAGGVRYERLKRGYRAAMRWPCGQLFYNLHYVKIAWGTFFLACLFVLGPAQLFVTLQRYNVLQKQGTKSMTGKRAEWTAWGVSKRAMLAGKVEFCLRGDKLNKTSSFLFQLKRLTN